MSFFCAYRLLPKGGKMKKTIAVVVSCVALVLCLAGCGSSTDNMFLDSLEQSITSRMENSDSTEFSTLVETELAYLDSYRDAEFSDSRIGELAALYISGVDKQKEALSHTDMMYEYQMMWQEGMVDRCAALKALNEEYDFMADNAEFIGTYVNGYEKQKFILDAIIAIEADISAQDDSGDLGFEWNNSSQQLKITLKNNTDYSFTTVYDFSFYDKEGGTLLETTQSWTEVKPQSTYVVTGYYTDSDAHWCSWVGYYDMAGFK